MAPAPDHTALLITLVSIFAPIAVAIIGYVLTTLHKNISAVEKGAKERHEAHAQTIRDTETRTTQYIHDVEARAVKRVEDAELRAEKGDERILQQVNSHYTDLKGQLENISKNLNTLSREGCGAIVACKIAANGG